jgi:cholesterol oxidase
MSFDAIVIGSGFGGAITGCRLAEAGYRVLILERGQRWDNTNFPRQPEDMWLWNHDHPEREHGWLDLRQFPNMAVAQGAGVGGGSLIYANISCEARPAAFNAGWPPEVTYQELKPYYDKVAQFMNVQPVPDNQWTARMKLMKEAAIKAGFGERFTTLELAVTFDPHWTYAKDWTYGEARSRKVTNAQGAEQGTCVHLGNCDIGCDVHAKNTLDRNYIYLAENKHQAEVRPLHLVTNIAPTADGYRVAYDKLAGGKRVSGYETARIVLVAAGSLGSTELLLKCREVDGTLPYLSTFLGKHWSSNGDFLTPAVYATRDILPTQGPTIASAIDFHDASQGGNIFWVEDGGFPSLLEAYLKHKVRDPAMGWKTKLFLESIQRLLRENEPFKHIMPWFAQGIDAADGTLSLQAPPGTCGLRRLHLAWDIKQSQKVIEAIIAMHKRLSAATGGLPLVPLSWSLFKDLITPHPLGGCNMGSSVTDGVVDHCGEVFGYKNLYVADAAIIPEAIGVNPSRTIGALAERIAEILIKEGR